jgi:dipeptidase
MDLPFSAKPDRKLSVEDIINFTRDKSYGTAYDPTTGIRGGRLKTLIITVKPGLSVTAG